jgi:hypothetical protein
VLCCAVLCCAVLCCAVLCCAVLCCAVLCCAVLCCAVLCLARISNPPSNQGERVEKWGITQPQVYMQINGYRFLVFSRSKKAFYSFYQGLHVVATLVEVIRNFWL